MGSLDLDLADLDALLRDQSYVCGHHPTQGDVAAWEALDEVPKTEYPHAARWYHHIASFGSSSRSFPEASLMVLFKKQIPDLKPKGIAPVVRDSVNRQKSEPQNSKPQKASRSKIEVEVRLCNHAVQKIFIFVLA